MFHFDRSRIHLIFPTIRTSNLKKKILKIKKQTHTHTNTRAREDILAANMTDTEEMKSNRCDLTKPAHFPVPVQAEGRERTEGVLLRWERGTNEEEGGVTHTGKSCVDLASPQPQGMWRPLYTPSLHRKLHSWDNTFACKGRLSCWAVLFRETPLTHMLWTCTKKTCTERKREREREREGGGGGAHTHTHFCTFLLLVCCFFDKHTISSWRVIHRVLVQRSPLCNKNIKTTEYIKYVCSYVMNEMFFQWHLPPTT